MFESKTYAGHGRAFTSTSAFALAASVALGGCAIGAGQEETAQQEDQAITTGGSDPTGQINTISTDPTLNLSTLNTAANPFFQSLGTNGRACINCHQPSAAMGITPTQIQQVFNSTNGTDPLFRTNDGSNSPNAPVATLAQRKTAYSMLLNRGLIRIGLPLPANAEFNLILVEDPYGFASANQLSFFRRPLPSTNLRFLSTVMWDGRENVFVDPTATPKVLDLNTALTNQSNDATLGHAQAAQALTPAQEAAIVAFETSVATAQTTDNAAGSLSAAGALGGTAGIPTQQFFIGINDPLGTNPTGAAFSNQVFTLYNAWSGLTGSAQNNARASIARGQNIFNTRTFTISGVRGLNGQAADPLGTTPLTGGCVICHNSPNIGDHSEALPLDIGVSGPDVVNTDTYPRYTVQNKTTGEIIRTSDLGRAGTTGKWADMTRFKGPILRGLAARPPYFHNGMAATVEDVVKFYDTRFHIGFTAQESADLASFLRAL